MILGSLQAHAQSPIESCARGSNKLYVDIQIYKQTKKISAQHAIVRERLQSELNQFNAEGSISDRVTALETGFKSCNPELTADDEADIQMEVEAILKMTHPFNSAD